VRYTFIYKFSNVLPCSCLCSRLRWQGLAFLVRSIHVTWIDNQWSGGVVTTRARNSVQSLRHQCRDLHQSTYLYLSEDRDPTSHQVVSDFRLPVRYCRVSFSLVAVFSYLEYTEKPTKTTFIDHFSAVLCPWSLRKFNS
jgi:hypothetical protein